jgi:hypothetical protein
MSTSRTTPLRVSRPARAKDEDGADGDAWPREPRLEHADRSRRGDDLSIVACRHLAEQHGEWCEQDRRRRGIGSDRCSRCARSGLRATKKQREEKACQECEDERAARTEVRELLFDVLCDHVRGHEPAKRPRRRVRHRPPSRTGDALSSTGTRPAKTAPKTSTRMINAAGSPICNSPFCRSSCESFSKSASAVSVPVIETWKPASEGLVRQRVPPSPAAYCAKTGVGGMA